VPARSVGVGEPDFDRKFAFPYVDLPMKNKVLAVPNSDAPIVSLIDAIYI
jgi:hypothetical protein